MSLVLNIALSNFRQPASALSEYRISGRRCVSTVPHGSALGAPWIGLNFVNICSLWIGVKSICISELSKVCKFQSVSVEGGCQDGLDTSKTIVRGLEWRAWDVEPGFWPGESLSLNITMGRRSLWDVDSSSTIWSIRRPLKFPWTRIHTADVILSFLFSLFFINFFSFHIYLRLDQHTRDFDIGRIE